MVIGIFKKLLAVISIITAIQNPQYQVSGNLAKVWLQSVTAIARVWIDCCCIIAIYTEELISCRA